MAERAADDSADERRRDRVIAMVAPMPAVDVVMDGVMMIRDLLDWPTCAAAAVTVKAVADVALRVSAQRLERFLGRARLI